MDDITKLSASTMGAMIRAGELSAREVTDAHIQRIEAVNDRINAVVIPLFDEALASATEADEKRRRGDPLGSLHGVPVTIKEQWRVAGTQTTLGATNKIGNVFNSEGPLVTKLRQSGAIIMGKTNIMQTLAGIESDNRVYGRSSNPWNLDRTPGGSSGGEAAIVAAGGSALGLAGDFGGSTRIPAHFCGVCGFKPTSGRLTNDDFSPGLLEGGQEIVIPQPGPITRTVGDMVLAMKIFVETSQRVTRDLVPPVPWRDPAQVEVKNLRIGYYTDNGYFPSSPAVRRAVKEAAEGLRKHGLSVSECEAPDARQALSIFLRAGSAAGGDDYKRLLGDEKPLPQVAGMLQGLWSSPEGLAAVEKEMASHGQRYVVDAMRSTHPCSAKEYRGIVEARNDYRLRFISYLDEAGLDAIICPPFALPALTHGSSEHLFLPAGSYAFTYNVLGAPAGVVPATIVLPGEESDRKSSKDMADITAIEVERGSAGLPVGVQVVARHWREDIVLAVMAALEDYFRSQPTYPALTNLVV
jgi:fatty acid amide hydrolase